MDLKKYLQDKVDEGLFIAHSDYVIDTVIDVFMIYNIPTENIDEDDCIKRASVQQLHYVSANIDRFKGADSGIKSNTITNYSASYKDYFDLLSPFALKTLKSCGYISTIIPLGKGGGGCGYFK